MISVISSYFFMSEPESIIRKLQKQQYEIMLFHAPATVLIGGELCDIEHNTCIIFDSSMLMQIEPVTDSIMYSSVRFTDPDGMVEKLKLPIGTIEHPWDSTYINSHLININRIYISKHTNSDEELDASLRLMLVQMSSRYLDRINTVPDKPGRDDSFFNARMEILSSPEKNWDAPEMAALTGMSVPQFYRRYQQLFGKSPKTDLLDYRFYVAKNMLREGVSISETATNTGFISVQHFSKFFKNREGTTPGAYKKSASSTADSFTSALLVEARKTSAEKKVIHEPTD